MAIHGEVKSPLSIDQYTSVVEAVNLYSA